MDSRRPLRGTSPVGDTGLVSAVEDELRVECVGLEALPILHRIRRVVFIEGQRVPRELEVDGLDAQCTHFLATWRGTQIGCARMRHAEGAAKAERVAVLAEHRGLGTGRALMRAVEAEARAQGFDELFLHAQEAVVSFYEELGYEGEGPRFEEAGIVHRAMRKTLSGGTASLSRRPRA